MAFAIWSFSSPAFVFLCLSFPFYVTLSVVGGSIWRVSWLQFGLIFWGWFVGVFGRRGTPGFLRISLRVWRRFSFIFIVFYGSGLLFSLISRRRPGTLFGGSSSFVGGLFVSLFFVFILCVCFFLASHLLGDVPLLCCALFWRFRPFNKILSLTSQKKVKEN